MRRLALRKRYFKGFVGTYINRYKKRPFMAWRTNVLNSRLRLNAFNRQEPYRRWKTYQMYKNNKFN